MSLQNLGDARVAVLVDCDNVSPAVLEHALLVVAQFGRIVLRRGYGNHGTLANKWQDALVRLAFTPCLQYQYASGKNTSDIALVLDAQEALFDQRADLFCLVTSDSDFAYLCRKLRERGAAVCIVGESKTPDALRNASDQFFEWRSEGLNNDSFTPIEQQTKTGATQTDHQVPVVKRRPRFVVEAVSLLTGSTAEGKVTLSGLGSYLKRTDPGFSPAEYGHSGLLEMVKTYDLLEAQMELGGHWTLRLATETKS
ncbi:NYN domain-containing protein [Pseudomonas coronafaciens]|uniref:NYN domain-containing protein n=1 Tax=Pseudomonas coronafaciens TaxID=53409 RepID=UPI000E3BB4DD|nr:NYN domain-containing protein [Pseudomonas coronafaciens]